MVAIRKDLMDSMLGSLMGFRLIGDPSFTESITEKVTVKLSFYDRFIDPLLHPIERPFEPWIKTGIVEVTKLVPSRNVLCAGNDIVAHPEMIKEIKRIIYDLR